MKRALWLAVLVLGVSVAVASADSPLCVPPVPEPDVASSIPAAPVDPVPEELAPIFLASCEISKDCPCGGGYVTITCVGEVSCTMGARWVRCDGVYTYCPPIGSCPP